MDSLKLGIWEVKQEEKNEILHKSMPGQITACKEQVHHQKVMKSVRLHNFLHVHLEMLHLKVI